MDKGDRFILYIAAASIAVSALILWLEYLKGGPL